MSVIDWDFQGSESVRLLRNGSEITRPLTIITDNDADSLDVLKRDLPDLQRWQPHPEQPGFFVDEFSAEKVRGTVPPMWLGAVRWTDTVLRNPLDEPARLVGIRTEKLPSATDRNRHGKAILNTAGELVAPIPKNEPVRIFTFAKNVPALVEELCDYEDVVNADAVQIMGRQREPRTLLLGKVEFSAEQEQDETKFYVCSVEIAYRKSKWVHKFPSKGFSQIVQRRATPAEILSDLGSQLPTINGVAYVRERQTITLADGQRPQEPQMLDAEGRWIPNPTPEQIHIIEEEVLDEVSFNNLMQLFVR